VGLVFVIWDSLFTQNGVWGFNERYLIDINIFHLPLEEWLFFLFVPYACIFIYECTNYFIRKRILQKVAKPLALTIAAIILVVGFLNLDRLYTSITFISTGILLIGHVVFVKKDYLDRFWLGYLFSLIPFLIVNGVLTGTGIEDQIVWYNNDENLGIRILTIPIEDSIYLLLYLLGIVTIYEEILKRWPNKTIVNGN
jgi:lycopene cyclase domain-containing protein